MKRAKLWGMAGALLGVGLSAMAAAPATAASPEMPHYGKWQSSKIGGGGYVQQVLATSDPKVYYCYIDNSGIYRSEDGGNTWRMLHGTLPPKRGCYNVRGLLVDPRDDKKIIAALGDRWNPCDGIYLSDDAGKTWHSSNVKTMHFDGDGAEADAPILARDPRNPDVILAVGYGTGLWRSTDNGMNWQKCGLEKMLSTGIFFDGKNPDRVWLCAQPMKGGLPGGFYESLDAGKTWKKVADAGPIKIAQDPKTPDRLYGIFHHCCVQVSSDAGRTWQMFSEGLALNMKNAGWTTGFFYKALTAGPDFVLAGSGNGTIYRIKPGETVWQKVPRETIHTLGSVINGFGAAMSNIAIDPRDANHWFFSDFFGIYQTPDGGKTWEHTIHGLELTVIHNVLQDPTDPAIVHLAMADCCFFTSLDGGKSFIYYHAKPMPPGGWNPKYLTNMAISAKDVDLSPKLPTRLYATASQGASPFPTRVYVSNDRGDTWDKSPMTGLDAKDINKTVCNSISVDPDDPDKVYIAIPGSVKAGGGGIYRSQDAGKSWTWLGQGLPKGPYFFFQEPFTQGKEVAAGPGGNVVCISKFVTGMWRLDAAQQTWIKGEIKTGKQFFLPYCVAADGLKPGRFFVGGHLSGVYRSEDGGATWNKVYPQSAAYIVCDKVVPNRVAAATDDGVILSRDGGKTWTMLDKSLRDRVYRNPLAFAGERLIAGSAGSGVFWIPLSAEGEKDVRARLSAK